MLADAAAGNILFQRGKMLLIAPPASTATALAGSWRLYATATTTQTLQEPEVLSTCIQHLLSLSSVLRIHCDVSSSVAEAQTLRS
jgi:hypothetical protein